MNDENLIPLNKRSKSEQRQIQSMGGLKSGENRRKRKTLKEDLIALLEDGSVQREGCLALINQFLKGNIKAFETIRDTIGEKPTEKTEFVGELPPLVVRELKTDDTRDGNCDTVSSSD